MVLACMLVLPYVLELWVREVVLYRDAEMPLLSWEIMRGMWPSLAALGYGRLSLRRFLHHLQLEFTMLVASPWALGRKGKWALRAACVWAIHVPWLPSTGRIGMRRHSFFRIDSRWLSRGSESMWLS